jgi:hypothetical protein
MEYIEAPNTKYPPHKLCLFLGGSITGCPNWQNDAVKKLKDLDIVIFNPRRKNFDVKDPTASEKQIKWEYNMLRAADMICFWFSKETLAPIVLFELGAHSMTTKPITIGMDPQYQRKQDVEIQMSLERPDIPITYSIDDFVDSIKNMVEDTKDRYSC